MSYNIPGSAPQTFTAGTDLVAYHFVDLSAQGTVVVPTAGGAVHGVVGKDGAVAGRGASVVDNGVSKVVAGGPVAVGGPVATDAQGRAVAAVDPAVAVGTAQESASAAGTVIAVRLTTVS